MSRYFARLAGRSGLALGARAKAAQDTRTAATDAVGGVNRSNPATETAPPPLETHETVVRARSDLTHAPTGDAAPVRVSDMPRSARRPAVDVENTEQTAGGRADISMPPMTTRQERKRSITQVETAEKPLVPGPAPAVEDKAAPDPRPAARIEQPVQVGLDRESVVPPADAATPRSSDPVMDLESATERAGKGGDEHATPAIAGRRREPDGGPEAPTDGSRAALRRPEPEAGEAAESRDPGPSATPAAATDRALPPMPAPAPEARPIETVSAQAHSAAPTPQVMSPAVVESATAVEVRIGTVSLEIQQPTPAVLPARPEPRRRREQPPPAVGLRRHYLRDR